jgi:hypothetical protein
MQAEDFAVMAVGETRLVPKRSPSDVSF